MQVCVRACVCACESVRVSVLANTQACKCTCVQVRARVFDRASVRPSECEIVRVRGRSSMGLCECDGGKI